MKELIELRKKARGLDPIIRIGKNGLTEGIVIQIRKALAARTMIKIKFLPSYMDVHDVEKAALELASRVPCKVIDHIGGVVVLYA